ncbi:FG-GAP repeat domain-containing protein [Actomonas aquatica]|uniref:VCBS repeat-containing protein n=1 Tax=Actomonas aquatica TaxID=2866162 RepID=A0ABZ1C675_9BACT|nr:VCBS repeat-containing protein [Opitutus sp. WL0086]WRQ86827.1 VCBS repeat-containing protein [Opitutus sp. WL0086]
MSSRPGTVTVSPLPILLGLATLVLWTACSKPPPRRQNTPSTTTNTLNAPVDAIGTFTGRELGTLRELPPWIGNLNVIDLDQDGLDDVVFCESQDNEVIWIRQTAPGVFAPEQVLATDMSGPVHVEAADMNGDGHTDLLISSMGVVFPNNDRIGTAFILVNDGQQQFTPHIVLANTDRIVDMRAADLNGDGLLDLVLGQFGYDQGVVSWLERKGPELIPENFERHVLLPLSGAINVVVDDFNGDRTPDIAALISQQWEEVYLFPNDGKGNFKVQRIWGSTNEDYGSSGMSSADLNGDGRPDLIYTNGDGFGPAATPGPRPWHGLQWFENVGGGNFRYHRVANFPGAYSPVAVDLDQDGALDIVASSAYSDWNDQNRNVISLMWFRNDGKQHFKPHILTRAPKDLITTSVGHFSADGRPGIVTGGFYIYPPFDNLSRIMLWTHAQPADSTQP